SLGAWPAGAKTCFRVWAPQAKSVELVLDSSGRGPCRLARERGGYFQAAVEDVAAGALYRFRVDGRGPFPDTASRYQPQGVHGPSQVIDPGAFPWSDPSWRGITLER